MGTVVRVTDGDSIEVETDVGAVEVRMVAINAPERDECFYREGLDHLIETLQDSVVTLEVVGTDQFDRTLAHVFEDERHVNLEMVSKGLAIAFTPASDDPHGTAILESEGEALARGVGLWASSACGTTTPPPNVAIDTNLSVVNPPGPDQLVLDEEVVAIVNRESTTVDLSGWILRDQSSRHRFVFPSGTTLGPAETMLVSSDDPGWSPGGTPVWNNSGDQALLQLPDGTVVSRWRY